MSQSQVSFYSDSFIDPDLRQSDDLPDLPSSQSTETSNSFTPLPQLSYAPKSLERVGSTLRKFWILYASEPEMEDSRKQFVEWWLNTLFGSNPQCRDSLHWDGKKTSVLWEQFEQVANEKTGEPRVMCKRCCTTLTHPGHKRTGTSALKAHLKGGTCRLEERKRGIDQLFRNLPRVPTKVFTNDFLQRKILNFLTTARLPFRIIEHPEFKDLLEAAQLSESRLDIPSARTIRRLLDDTVREQQKNVLSKLPKGSHLSIALDCWTSPFSQAFMAITGYFLDQEWNYCEVLLGFEHLQGSHTGAHLSQKVIQILQEHNINDRVLSITTDNASNNNTMMLGVQEMVQSHVLSETSVFRIPCIAHVIQLSLKDLLGKIKAHPTNKEAESEWPDARMQSLQTNSRRPIRDIVITLKKIRELAVFINASPQRREAFLTLQTTEPKLVPIQDVRTRWNSTFLMLNRARELQSVFDRYCIAYQHVQFKLDQEEWRQVEYLLLVTKPFYDFTSVLSKTRDVTVHHVFSIYNRLFTHLDDAEKKLKRKAVPWKRRMLQALRSAKRKLLKYYTATDYESYGIVYAIATILCPSKKLRYFESADWRGNNWKGEEVDFTKHYREVLQKEFKRYQQQFSQQTVPADSQETVDAAQNELELLCEPETALRAEVDQREDELTRYLAKGLTKGNPRLFWKEHEHEYPILAKIARDILSVPASGAGVERLFNCARDVCHYRRGQLKPDTIKGLMLHLFSSKFDLEQTELEMIKGYLSVGEVAMLDQTRKSIPPLNEVEPISDNEDEGCEAESTFEDDTDESDNEAEEESSATQSVAQTRQIQRKRCRSKTSEALDDADNGLPLPVIPIEEKTQARPGRVRKKPKLPEGFEIDKL